MGVPFKQLLFALLAALLISGCSFYRIDSEDTSFDFYPPKKSADQVVVIEKAEKPHEIIGMTSVSVERTQSKSNVEEKMRAEAAALGGDAIMGVQVVPDGPLRLRYTAKVVAFK